MKINIYNLFKKHNLVNNYKEYNELVRLKCMYVNGERIYTPLKFIEMNKKVISIKAGFKKVLI